MKHMNNKARWRPFRLAVQPGSTEHVSYEAVVQTVLDSYKADPDSKAAKELDVLFALMSDDFLGIKKKDAA